jgi:5-methylcytosine-specific restriction enzyme subunit McrC
MRGRLLADRQVLQRFGRLDRLECRFDELELDIDENRLLAAALRVAHQRVSDGLVRHRLASLRGIFEPICDEKMLDLSAARGRMRDGFYDRLNAHYWPAHRLAWLLLEGLGVEDLLRRGDTRCFAFLLDMNALFQGLVERLFRTALPSAYDVEAQAAQHSIIWNVAEQRSHSSLIPDLLVRYEPGALRLAVDAKYKLYDERRIDPSDVYQTFLYAYALGAPTDGARPSALIVYPASGEDPRALRLRIQPTRSTVEADIETLAIDIPNVLNELYEAGPRPMLDQVRATVERLLGLRSNESVDN